MKLKSIILSLVAIAVLGSCGTSNNVVGGGIQKRKYNDGYYVSLGKKFNKTNKEFKGDEIVLTEETKEKIETKETSLELENQVASTEIISTSESEVITIENRNDFEPLAVTKENNARKNNSKNQVENVNTNSDKSNNTYTTIKLKTVTSPNSSESTSDAPLILLIILAIILPWLAVGIYTSWDVLYTVIAVLLWLLFWLPGIIFALCVIFGVI